MPRGRPLRTTSSRVIRVPITGAIGVRGTTPVPALRACRETMPTIALCAVELYANQSCRAGERRGLGRSHGTGPASVVHIDGGGRARRGATRSAMLSHGNSGSPTRYNSGGSISVGTGFYGYPGGMSVIHSTPSYYESKLRLTFTTNTILAAWTKK